MGITHIEESDNNRSLCINRIVIHNSIHTMWIVKNEKAKKVESVEILNIGWFYFFDQDVDFPENAVFIAKTGIFDLTAGGSSNIILTLSISL